MMISFKPSFDYYCAMIQRIPFVEEDIQAINRLAEFGLKNEIETIGPDHEMIGQYLTCLANAPFSPDNFQNMLYAFIRMHYPDFRDFERDTDVLHAYFDAVHIQDPIIKTKVKLDIARRMLETNIMGSQSYKNILANIIKDIDASEDKTFKIIMYMHLFHNGCIDSSTFVNRMRINCDRNALMFMLHRLDDYWRTLPFIVIDYAKTTPISSDLLVWCSHVMLPTEYDKPEIVPATVINQQHRHNRRLIEFLEYMKSEHCRDLLITAMQHQYLTEGEVANVINQVLQPTIPIMHPEMLTKLDNIIQKATDCRAELQAATLQLQ